MTRALLLTVQMAVAALLVGCDGGLIGTGTGPKPDDQTIANLPDKISPRLPRSIVGSPTLSRTDDNRPQKRRRQRFSDQLNVTQTNSATALLATPGWQILQPSMQQIDTTRIAVQELLTLLDSVLLDTLQRCHSQLDSALRCTLATGSVRTEYSDATTDAMLAVYINDDSPLASEFYTSTELDEIQQYYRALQGTPVIFDELTLAITDVNPLTYQLQTSTASLLSGSLVDVQWHADQTDIVYRVATIDASEANHTYRFINNSSGQKLTVSRADSGDQFNPAPQAIEIFSASSSHSEILYNALFDGAALSGRATDDLAYALFADYDTGTIDYRQELFTGSGTLIAVEVCNAEPAFDSCLIDGTIADNYDAFISPLEFELSVQALGFSTPIITGLAPTVRRFAVVANNAGIELNERVQLCNGWQSASGVIELFCVADDRELSDAVVISLDGLQPALLPMAQIITVQP